MQICFVRRKTGSRITEIVSGKCVCFQWEFEKWKFENKNQVVFFSLVTGKALRIKSDGTVDGLGEQTDPGGECALMDNGSAVTFSLSGKGPLNA